MEKRKINAKIIADSKDNRGNRITTYILTYPRIIHAEVMTHRMFSRNAASSRAIPFNKMVTDIEDDPFIPIAWQKDHKGMQGTEYITDKKIIDFKTGVWLNARNKAVQSAKELNGNIVKQKQGFISEGNEGEIIEASVTKQLCNRLLEPFQWYTCLVTATEFDNFFSLRCPSYGGFSKNGKEASFRSKKDVRKHFKSFGGNTTIVDSQCEIGWQSINTSQAEIHIQALAEAMWDAMNESTPKLLNPGEWHIPFGKNIDDYKVFDILANSETFYNKREEKPKVLKAKIAIATARAARLSYMTFNNEIDYKKDIELHDNLLKSKHASPFEHCAQCMSDLEYYSNINGKICSEEDDYGIFNLEYYPYFNGEGNGPKKGVNSNNDNRFGWSRNFKGFTQYRELMKL